MAVLAPLLSDKDKDEESKSVASAPQPIGNPVAPAPAAPSMPKGPSKTSGQFTNLNKYLKANVGEGEKIASNIGSKIETQAADVRAGIEAGKQKFGQDVAANTLKVDQDLLNRAISNPVAAAGSEDFQKLRQAATAKYAGPTALDSSLEAQASGVQNLASKAGSQEGRFGLIRDVLGRPTYTGGQQRLDSLLLQRGSGQALQNLMTGAQQAAASTGSTLTSAQQFAAEAAKKAAEDTAAAAAETQRQLTGAYKGTEGALQSKAAQASAQLQSEIDAAKLNLRNDILPQWIKDQYGEQLANINLYDIDPTQFFKAGRTELNAADVASADEAARLNALAQLSGNQSLLQGLTAQGSTGRGTFDIGGLQAASARRKAEMEADPEIQKLQGWIKNNQAAIDRLSAPSGSYATANTPLETAAEVGGAIAGLPGFALAKILGHDQRQSREEADLPNQKKAEQEAMQKNMESLRSLYDKYNVTRRFK